MDLTETIAPRSDQLNADDLMGGPRTVTVVDVRKGDPDQPVHIVTAEFGDGRPYKPSKSMRRVLVAAWGTDSTVYAGRRATLYRDPSITFGKDEVGGIRISHLSDIDKPLKLALTVKRGKREPFVVQPLPDAAPPRDWITEAQELETSSAVADMWREAKAARADAATLDALAAIGKALKEQEARDQAASDNESTDDTKETTNA